MARSRLRRSAVTCLIAIVPLAAAIASAETLTGRVSDRWGAPVAGATVEAAGAGTQTDREGAFALADVTLPALLVVRHSLFEPFEISVDNPPAGAYEITLADATLFHEEVRVLAEQIGGRYSPRAISAVETSPREAPSSPRTVAEIVVDADGVSENGQGGLFQVVSVRGVAGHRVLNMISGMRLTTERRAGVSSSFLDAELIDEVDVLRGPASTYYGSGALGGAIQIFPRSFERLHLSLGYDSAGSETFQTVGWGNADWSLGLTHRTADDSTTPDGAPRFDRFSQVSAVLRRIVGSERLQSTIEVIPTRARDIGKPNAEFPQRTTIYPGDDHLLARYSLDGGNRQRGRLFLHASELETRVSQAASVNVVENESFDFGAGWERSLGALSESSSRADGRIGVDYFGRRRVDAIETALDRATGQIERAESLRDGEEDEVAAFGVANRGFQRVRIEGGGRATWVRQSNRSLPATEHESASAFLSLGASVVPGLELLANVGTGVRVPNLSERFFTGTTGRGQVVGNRDLDEERSLNTELTLRYGLRRFSLAASVYRNRIDDYIERVTIAPNLRSYRNLTDGTIRGIDLTCRAEPVRDLRLDWGLHQVEGDSTGDRPLADIPPPQLRFGASRTTGRWRFVGRLRYRFEKEEKDVGNGEQPMGEAWILDASVGRQLRDGLEIKLHGRNLLDETYLPSADELAVPAAERSLGVGLAWSP